MKYSEIIEWAKETGQEVKVLAWGYGNAYNEQGEFVKKTEEPNWIRLTSPDMGRIEKFLTAVKWQYLVLKRHIFTAKNIPIGIKRWWKLRCACKRANKYLLEEAERVRNRPPHEPPTPEEVLDFMEWARENGINFENRVQPLPKTPPASKEVWL
jgi:hypothetical protein